MGGGGGGGRDNYPPGSYASATRVLYKLPCPPVLCVNALSDHTGRLSAVTALYVVL